VNIFKILILLLSLVTIGCEHIEYAEPQYAYQQNWQLQSIDTDWVMGDEVVNYINQYRIEQGLPPLVKEPNLTSALAAQHCNYMISQQAISHDGFSDRAEILNDNGAVAVGENVAFGYNNAYDVVSAWINSPSHRDTIEGNYTHIGLGIRHDNYNTNYITMIVVRF